MIVLILLVLGGLGYLVYYLYKKYFTAATVEINDEVREIEA